MFNTYNYIHNRKFIINLKGVDTIIKQKIDTDIMEYMVWVIEITAIEFFEKDKTAAYNALQSSGLWDIYVEHYDTTHTLGKEYLINEIREYFIDKGINIKSHERVIDVSKH